jgi:hypothetical protein
VSVERITHAEFLRRCEAQGVQAPRDWAFVCPICGTVQSARSLLAAGVPEDKLDGQLAFSCEGRWTGAGSFKDTPSRRLVRGCDWTLGGLFTIHELEVEVEGAEKPRPCFAIATSHQAQDLRAELKTRNPA